MFKRNAHFAKLHSGYLFPEINKRKKHLLTNTPEAKIISLGIGDTTEPIFPVVSKAMQEYAKALGTHEGYSGYGFEQGNFQLRHLISETFYHGHIHSDDIFISDGAKCDLGRLQFLFGDHTKIALQDPAYPVYVDTSVIRGQTSTYDPEHSLYKGLVYMPCLPENDFFPDLNKLPKVNVIFFCSPNNPTGAAATRDQLTELVAYAKKNQVLILYDAAYAAYIKDPNYPKTIYEIEGAKEVAIEISSFSKMAGFTGLRLGWSVVPRELLYEDGSSIKDDWNRINSTFFNGASNIVQAGGIAALSNEGLLSMKQMIAYYMENASIIKNCLIEKGLRVYGGDQAPYLWAKFPNRLSWDVFEELLVKSHILSTPGVGFGPSGESFIRFSAFGQRTNIEEAAQRLKKH